MHHDILYCFFCISSLLLVYICVHVNTNIRSHIQKAQDGPQRTNPVFGDPLTEHRRKAVPLGFLDIHMNLNWSFFLEPIGKLHH